MCQWNCSCSQYVMCQVTVPRESLFFVTFRACHSVFGSGCSNAALYQVTELLYLKQTQLERLAAEKAAQQLSLERELAAVREQAERVNRCHSSTLSVTPNYCAGKRLLAKVPTLVLRCNKRPQPRPPQGDGPFPFRNAVANAPCFTHPWSQVCQKYGCSYCVSLGAVTSVHVGLQADEER